MGPHARHPVTRARKPELILSGLLALLLIPGIFLTIADLARVPPQIDFAAYYLAAQALRAGQDPFDATLAERLAAAAGIREHTPYIYPPLLALTIQPLTFLPYPFAAAIWFVLSVLALVLSVRLLLRFLQIPPRLFPYVAVLVVFLPPVHYTLELGQINHFLLLLLVAAAVELSARRDVSVYRAALPGLLVGSAAALKVFPMALGIVFLLTGDFIAFAAMLLTAGLLTVGSILYGSNAVSTMDWFQQIAPQITAERLITPNNQSLHAVFSRLFNAHSFEAVPLSSALSTNVTLRPLVQAPAYASLIAVPAAAVVMIVTMWALLATRHAVNPVTQITRFALMVTATLLVLPVVWDHYYVLLLLPIAALYLYSDQRFVRLGLLLSLVLIVMHRYWRLTLYTGSSLLLSAGLAGVVGLWILLLWVLRREPAIIRDC